MVLFHILYDLVVTNVKNKKHSKRKNQNTLFIIIIINNYSILKITFQDKLG